MKQPKEAKLTKEIVDSLKTKSIIYAEIAEGGAMGDAGSARLYVYADGKVLYYYCSLHNDNPEENEGYGALYEYLDDEDNRNVLDYCYAGFGNHAYKDKAAKLVQNDDECGFEYTLPNSKDKYLLRCSCQGVYMHIAMDFASDGATKEKMRELGRHARKFSPDECYFLEDFVNYLYSPYLTTTLEDYFNAICYIRHINGMDSNYDCDFYIGTWRKSMAKYRLRYVIEKYSQREIANALVGLTEKDAKPGVMFDRISKKCGEDISKVFTKYTVEKWTTFNIEDYTAIRFPVVVELPKTLHAKILHEILGLTEEDIAYKYSLGYYFAGYILNAKNADLVDALPAALHVLKMMPSTVDIEEAANNYWAAADIVNTAWKIISEPETPESFEREIYDACWPKIGSIWPIEHYGEYKFCHNGDKTNEVAHRIFDEALGFVINLEHLNEYNPKLSSYLRHCSDEQKCVIARNRTLRYNSEKMTDEAALEYMLRIGKMEPRFLVFYYPTNKKRAKILFDEIMKGDDGLFAKYNRRGVLLDLYASTHKLGVGSYLLKLAVDNFDQIHEILGDDDTVRLFFAACDDPETDMLHGLEEFSKKVLTIPDVDKKAIDNAKWYATKTVAIVATQRIKLRGAYVLPCKPMIEEELPFPPLITPIIPKNEDIDLDEDQYRAAAQLAIKFRRISTAMIQRYLHVGDGRAAIIVEYLEELGAIGPAPGGNKPREVIIRDIAEFDKKRAAKPDNYSLS